MSAERPVDPVGRLVLYRTWDRRCAWCRGPVAFSDFEVEHLVPSSLAGPRLAEVLAQHGLDPGFDRHAWENLAVELRPVQSTRRREHTTGRRRAARTRRPAGTEDP